MSRIHFVALLLYSASAVFCQNIILTNDDGWAVAQIRAQFDALNAAGFNTVLSAPALQESGSGSKTTIPIPLNQSCEFNTCPIGSPATGFNASDRRLNYVNAFPVDSARFGIQTLFPRLFGSSPDFVVSGPNVGTNLGSNITSSGTVGAACEAAKEGIPSTAFSGANASQVIYTTLDSDPDSTSSVSARLYASLVAQFTRALLTPAARPILPINITLNVNLANTNGSGCTDANNFKFVFTRVISDLGAIDVQTCGSTHLPDETTVIGSGGCFVSVTVIDANTKKDVNATVQTVVLNRLQRNLDFSCFNSV